MTEDWDLIRVLKVDCSVTLTDGIHESMTNVFCRCGVKNLLVLDSGGAVEQSLRTIRWLRDTVPELVIVLVDGGLTQQEIADAFREGIRDYFPMPYDMDLLAERISCLIKTARRLKSHG